MVVRVTYTIDVEVDLDTHSQEDVAEIFFDNQVGNVDKHIVKDHGLKMKIIKVKHN
jgi:hypothetical protein